MVFRYLLWVKDLVFCMLLAIYGVCWGIQLVILLILLVCFLWLGFDVIAYLICLIGLF